MAATLTRRRLLSLLIAGASLALATAPLPGLRRPLVVAVGSELAGAMAELEPLFERRHGAIDLAWRVQGSQDMVNRAREEGPERPRVLIPANRDLLGQLAAELRSQGGAPAFLQAPVPVARTLLVAVAWPERLQRLFPDGRFSWPLLRRAAGAGQWGALGGPEGWGSFDLRSSDPMRSNSGQLTLALWCRDGNGDGRGAAGAGGDCAAALRRAVYRPARSTDILLQEFISGGPNEGDLALVYEASALARLGEAGRQRPGGYVLLFPDPTIETVLAAAVLRGEAAGRAEDGERLVAFLLSPKGQAVLTRLGFRAADGSGGSPAARGVKRLPPPSPEQREELLRLWQQAG
ncbi:substrate-binding domain-containing protein [Cyanobium gracile UHCC 0139]|uniref:Substrate-binding domain-containing protein n=1 Tax=Cyanobium gracile UHCC 0139 TaxID=3110308 RepID=A0ABU5RSS6_9CYAN|nr:substrate-binding domain-containing protein [Cyanobium gracile]MEA5390800.1 substrate-binding domain-containing protein [Cyanobium gracile UHCC 0139]